MVIDIQCIAGCLKLIVCLSLHSTEDETDHKSLQIRELKAEEKNLQTSNSCSQRLHALQWTSDLKAEAYDEYSGSTAATEVGLGVSAGEYVCHYKERQASKLSSEEELHTHTGK